MRILFLGKNHSQGLKESDPSSFAGRALELGHELVESLQNQPEIVICVDYRGSDMRIINQARKSGIPTVLIINEPEVVIPQQYSKQIRRKFNKVLEIGRPDSSPRLKWPQTFRSISKITDRRQSAVMINADKWSFITGQLYWLRAGVASECSTVEVIGHGWIRPFWIRVSHRLFELLRTIAAFRLPNVEGIRYLLSRPISYKGTAEDKVEAMSAYKVAVVIENSQMLVTEKLFDAWFAGCVPVYVGPDLRSLDLPSDLAFPSLPSRSALEKAIAIAMAEDHTRFLQKLEHFLESSAAADWRSDNAIRAALDAALDTNVRQRFCY